MGRSSQRKGADGERELADLLRAYGYNVQRGGSLTYGSVPDLIGLPGIHVECKRVERLDLSAAIAQAARDAERFHDGVPVVIHRQNRRPWLVTMMLPDFLQMIGGDNDNGQQDV